MDEDKQRIAIGCAARQCGIYSDDGPVPDYLHDLNACRDMEECIPTHLKRSFGRELKDIVDGGSAITGRFDPTHATASQRCKAFLKTIGKWEDVR